MIRTLKIRLILTVLAVLLLASVGLVAVINGRNWQSLESQAYAVLQTLSDNGGQRPRALETEGAFPGKKEKPDGEDLPVREERGLRGRADPNAVSLTNYFTAQLDAEGAVYRWSSDRADLYSDESVQASVSAALADGKQRGRVDTQYYQRTDNGEGSLLVVLDARLEIQSARQVLRTTALVALAEDIVLSIGAVFLIRRAVKPVDEAMEKQRQFVWDASHELKTPLAVISANAEALAAEGVTGKPLDYIQSEVKRTDQLIQSLLTLARMEKSAEAAPMTDFDLGRAIEEVALPFESTVFEAGKTMELQIPERVEYRGNPEMIKQLAVILLSNAEKYSDSGGAIRVTLESRGDRRVFTVHNTGPAIPREAQGRIFDRFYRVDSSHNRAVEGNGLGLAIARSIVEIHRGKITVSSEEGKGTTFAVVL